MTRTAIPNFFSQFFDDDGNPLAGGFVYTYEAGGTVTPKATYNAASGGSANANPVELDANGRAKIFLDGTYNIVLKDADGNAVTNGSGDNIYSLQDDDIPSLTSNPFVTEATAESNTTVDLGALASHVVLITGTTTITSFGSSASVDSPIYFIRFSGALTLTHNGTSLILSSGQDTKTKSGDSAIVQYLGSGNWKVIQYFYVNSEISGVKTISSSANLNTIVTPGLYALSGSSYTNGPVDGTTLTAHLEVRGRTAVSSSSVTQTIYRMSALSSARMYQRTTNDSGSTWTEWQSLNGETLLGTSTPTAVATVDFTNIPSRYAALVLRWSGISCDTTTRALRITSDAGAGLGSQNHAFNQITSTTVSNVVTGLPLFTAVTQTNAQVAAGCIVFWGYQDGMITHYSGYAAAGDGGTVCTFNGMVGVPGTPVTTALVGLRAYWDSTGNFDAGTIALYGVN